MGLIWEGITGAVKLFFQGDPEVMRVTALTLRVSSTATLLSLLLGVPAGALLALREFPGRRFLLSLVNTGMGLPPVVVGLWVSIFLWRSGPLGRLHLMYTPTAIVIAQGVIAFPIITALVAAAIMQLPKNLHLQLRGLGASPLQEFFTLIREARLGILAAVIAGFGSIISEVGAANMVGGNIMGSTRVLTTATMMEVSKGRFEIAIALSTILLMLTYIVTLTLTLAQQRRRTVA